MQSRLQIPNLADGPLPVNAAGNPLNPNASGMLPGYDARGVNHWRNAFTQMDNNYAINDSEVWLFQANGNHGFNDYKLEWDAAYSSDESGRDNKLITVNGPATGIHATVDRSNLLKPRIAYTGGTPLQYGLEHAVSSLLQNQLFENANSLLTLRADLTRPFATRHPFQLMMGAHHRSLTFENNPTSNHVHNYTGALGDLARFATRPINPFGLFDDRVNVDPRLAAIDLAANPARWVADPVVALRQSLAQDGDIEETISAAYVMGKLRVEKLVLTGGVRWEGTEVKGRGFTFSGARPGVPVEQQYTETRTQGDYDNVFPSAFAQYELRKNVLLRASYSNGIGRPAFGVLRPTTSVSTTPTATGAAGSITQPDPALKPQYVDNYDLALEYYWEPSGMLSFSLFRKEIADFHEQVTRRLDASGGGFGPEFANYDLVTRRNFGSATVTGWEAAYQQQFVFLPGFLSGLGGFANWTHLDAKLDIPTVGEALANHIPDTVNLGLSYQRAPWSIRILGFWRSDYVLGYNANPTVNFLRKRIFDMDVKLEYAFHRRLRLFADVYNVLRSSPLTAEGHRFDDHALRPAYIYKLPVQIEVGIKGTW